MFHRVFLPLLVTAALATSAISYAQSHTENTQASGCHVIVTHTQWRAKQPGTASLAFDFSLIGTSGKPLTFIAPAPNMPPPIRLSGWTSANFDPSISHEGAVTYSPNSGQWHGELPGLDPSASDAHIEIEMLDPKTQPAQSSSQTSTMSLDKVPVPGAVNFALKVNGAYTTPWGTTLTLKTVSLISKDGVTANSTRYTFAVRRTRVTDDRIQIHLVSALDSGAPVVEATAASYSAPGSKGSVVCTSGPITSGSHKPVNLVFRVDESALSQTLQERWIPVEADIALAGQPTPLSNRKLKNQSYYSDGATQYSAIDTSSPQAGSYQYLLYASSQNPSEVWRYIDAEWSVDQGAAASKTSHLTSDVRWHIDGSPLLEGQTGARFTSTGRNSGAYPLLITAEPTVTHQHTVTFPAIPVPSPGEFTLLNQAPAGSPDVSLVLRSIKWLLPSGDPDVSVPAQYNTPFTLKLEFVYTTDPSAIVSLAIMTARDKEGNSLAPCETAVSPSTMNPLVNDPTKRVFTASVSIPPHGSKTIRLQVVVAAQSPSGPLHHFSINAADQWKSLDPAAAGN